MAEGAHPRTGTPHKRVGSVVRDKYRVEAFLAAGTMANVYAATHRNGAKVALKILHKQLAEDPSLCERFKREGYFANAIGHPGIVRAIDDDLTEDGCPFLVMELLEGETLDERRRRKGGKLTLRWLLPVADSLLEVLAAAHARDVVHRDLKPDNVFVTKTGEVKVLDFGVARWNDGKDSSDMTAVGMVLGTPAYMPPEQALGRREEVDAQSDLWAVGATLFVALSGESVHEGGDAKAKLIATARTAARPLREAAPEVPRAVAAVIDRALAFHKSERWPDAEAMREALRWARLSLEDRPSQAIAAEPSQPELEAVPPPAPTRRTFDDEATVARAFPMPVFDSAPSVTAGPMSTDFLTSAPPITLREASTSTAATTVVAALPLRQSEPVFSLRREKEGDHAPATVRIPQDESTADDPAAAIDLAATAENAPARPAELNISFTRPMAVMAMPHDYEVPRPAATAAAPAPAAHPTGSAPPGMLGSVPPPGFSQPRMASSHPMHGHRPSGPSLATDVPGPLLAEVVEPTRGRTARIVVPLVIALAAVVAIVLVVRARVVNARAKATAGPLVTAPVGSAAPSSTPSAMPPALASSPPASSTQGVPPHAADPKPAAAAAATAEVKKPKPKPRKKPAPKPPAEPAVTDVAPATTATTSEPSAPPVDTTPKDPAPAKEPEPKPTPAPASDGPAP